MSRKAPVVPLAILLLLTVSLAGCLGEADDSEAEEAPGDQVEASSYTFEAGNPPDGRTGQGELGAPSGRADVELTSVGRGEASIVVYDATGEAVVERSFTPVESSVCNTCNFGGNGQPGTWTVEVDASTWIGQFSVTVEGS